MGINRIESIFNSLVCTCFFLAIPVLGNCQHVVKGRTVLADMEPVMSATIILLNASDSSFVLGTLSDQSGEFELKGVKLGQYILSTTMVGYKPYFRFVSVEHNLTVDKIILTEDQTVLDEVVVSASKPLFEQSIDKLTINVKNSVTTVGGNALDLLRKSPGITVDIVRNRMEINGKTGLIVMINGRISRQPLDAIMQMLNGLNASSIEKIEIINNPSAKYEASGNAGIINIILAENESLGTNGSLTGTLGYGRHDKEAFAFDLNHRSQKTNIYSVLSFNRDHSYDVMTNDKRVVNNDTAIVSHTQSLRDPVRTVFDGKVGIDYQFSKRTVVGGVFSANSSMWKMRANTTGESRISPGDDTRFFAQSTETNHWTNAMANINLQQQLSSKSDLSVSVDYLRYNNRNPTTYKYEFTNLSDYAKAIEEVEASKDTPIDIWVAALDYKTVIGKNANLEVGLKRIQSSLDNEVDIRENEGSGHFSYELLSNNSTLKEKIFAAYTSLDYQIHRRTKVKVGLRYEHTSSVLRSAKDGILLDLNYGNFFPTVFVNHSFADDVSVVFSYGKRITRPSFNDLAPFIIFLDPTTYFTGNLALQKSLSDNLNVGYSFKKSLVSLDFNHAAGAISIYQPIVLPNTSQQVFTSLNLKYRNTLSLSLTQAFSLARWWTGSINLVGVALKLSTAESQVLKSNYLQIKFSQEFRVSKNTSVELFAYHQTRSTEGVSTNSGYLSLAVGFQRRISTASKLNFNVNYFHNYDDFTAKGLNVDFFTNTNYRYEAPVFKLSYMYTFGNRKLNKPRERSGSAEDIRNRVN